MTNLKHLLLLIPVFILLSACSAETGCAPETGRDLAAADEPNTGQCADTGAPANIAITYPRVGTITHLTDKAGTKTGIYSYAGSVTVTDKNGNAVADNTLVQLDVIDTILAAGTINTENGDSISGSSLLDTNPTVLADEFDIAAADFSTVNVNVKGASIGIDAQSLIIITNGANKQDQSRRVSSVSGNTAYPTVAYQSSYPNTSYPSGSTKYVIGKTTLGMAIIGIDPKDGTETTGYTKTKDGKASFRIQYPANDSTINIGCPDIPAIDSRYISLDTRDVWVTAQVDGNTAITVVDDDACFYSIAPVTFDEASFKANSGEKYTLTLTDAEDVGIPFTTIEAQIFNEDGLNADPTGSPCETEEGGQCEITVTGEKDDTITYSSGDSSVVITIQ